MTTIVLLIYLLVLIFIAQKSYTKVENYADFFVARKKGSYLAITGSLTATILGGSAVIGSIDAGVHIGWASSWFMLCASIGLIALIPLTKKISKIGRYTLPELLEDMYGKNPKLIASFIIPVAWLGIIAAQVIAAAKILQSFTGMNYEIGVVIAGVVFTGYTIAGGQISILKTDIVQAILILTGLISVALFVDFSPRVTVPVTASNTFPFNINFKPVDLVVLLITYATTFTVGPDIYSRIFCANNHKTARKAIITTAVILIPVAFIIGFLSVASAEGNEMRQQGTKLIDISMNVLPTFAIPVVVIALLSAVLSSADTTILSSSIILTDLIEHNNFGENSLRTTRIIIVVIGIISIAIAFHFTSIIGMLLIALTVYSGAFTIPIITGLLGMKVKSVFVSFAIATGGLTALTGKLIALHVSNNIGNLIIIVSFAISAMILLAGKKKDH